MTYEEELEQQKTTERNALARLDFDIDYCESKMLRCEKPSTEYFHFLINLNALKKKRQMVVSKIVDLRLEIEKIRQPTSEVFNG